MILIVNQALMIRIIPSVSNFVLANSNRLIDPKRERKNQQVEDVFPNFYGSEVLA